MAGNGQPNLAAQQRSTTDVNNQVRPAPERHPGTHDQRSGRQEARPLLMIGHFTPPVHGMAVAMDALADLFERRGPVIRIRTVPTRNHARYRHHFYRMGLVSVAIGRLIRARKRSAAALFSVDAGYGMCYTMALALVGRRLGYGLTFDHHSSAYITRRSRLMQILVRSAGGSAVHIFKCELVAERFLRMYGPRVSARTVGVAYAAALPGVQTDQATSGERELVLGHLSNLSVAKGLDVAISLGRLAVHRGLACKLIVAGPVSGQRERNLLRQAVADGYVEYRGSVFGPAKDAFFRDVHVFVLPSQYKNELSPLVVWEAQLHGVPVITYRVGCLTQGAVGKGSLIVDTEGDFVEAALIQLQTWANSRSDWEQASANAVEFATAQRLKAIRDVLETAARVFEP
jgi:glycosyltransferase involved in cell wall biosynthesis